ncbi:MAG: NAD(P)/FAD-dependent oxidoreductase [Pseudomonadota bacterium]
MTQIEETQVDALTRESAPNSLHGQNQDGVPKVVILGAGFGGLAAAKSLSRALVSIELVDRRNYHLFQPLLYQVATADLSPADISWPIRSIFSRQGNVAVTMSEVEDIDLAAQKVICNATEIDYDYLIVATGATHSYFGKDHWAEYAPGLKRLVDATDIRRRILLAFERAELAKTNELQAREMTFVVVGGGPTGVEMAGAIAELAHYTLAKDFRRISPVDARIVLIEAGPRLLASFPETLSEEARAQLEKRGVEVWLDTMVEDIDADSVVTSKGRLPCTTKVWGAGVKVDHLARWLDCETDRSGRVSVNADLSLPGHPNVFVIGDAAKSPWRDGYDVPGIAPAAKQGGRYVAQVIADRVAGKMAPHPFQYSHGGNLATVGRNAAVIDFGRIQLSGAFAWWLWGVAHVFFLIGVRKPMMVALSWFWSYLTYSKGARLITGAPHLASSTAGRVKPPAAPAPTPGE